MKLNEILRESHQFESNKEQIDKLMQGIVGKNRNRPTYTVESSVVNVHVDFYCDEEIVVDGRFRIQFGTSDGGFDCSSQGLVTLEGAPSRVTDVFDCGHNLLTTLKFAPRINGGLTCWSNHIKTLVGIADLFDEIAGPFEANFDDITSGGIGLILIPKITELIDISGGSAFPLDIIKKYLGRSDAIFECQAELIENGFEEFALL